MITITNLTKAYQGIEVLNISELHIPAGESLGLVGNNGAGKTTLFSLLLDLIEPTTGELMSKEQKVARSEHWKKYTGAYLDENFLIDFLTPMEYFEFVGKLYSISKGELESRLALFQPLFNGEILEKNKYIRDLSKGNQKKVGLAAAMLGEPEILILDEPFANLDPSSQIKLKNLIRELPETITVLISSHDLSHVTDVCKRIVVLEKGVVIRDIETNATATLKELEAYFSA